METTKRELSLDFTKPRYPRGGQPAPSLVTPILNLSTPTFNLSTPEQIKMISSEVDLAVLTPNGISSVLPQSTVLPSPLIPTTVNSNNIMTPMGNNTNDNLSNGGNNVNGNNTNNISHNNNTNNNSSSNNNHCNSQNGNSQKHKQSGKTKDMDIEKIEKKRERNRLAAKKCRQRKLETIEDLRKTVSDWQDKYTKLEREFERFKAMRNCELERLNTENAELKSLINNRQ